MNSTPSRNRLHVCRRSAVVAVLCCCVVLPFRGAPAVAQQVSGREVRMAVETAVVWLENHQQPDGNWSSGYDEGGTALVTLALINAGVSPARAGMKQAISIVRGIPLEKTYWVSLKIQVLAAADADAYVREIREAAKWLVSAQREDGAWSYGLTGGRTDFSNTQFALLGLHEAAKVGAPVPDRVWMKAAETWARAQLRDGGWCYIPPAPGTRDRQGSTSTGSMTAAGVASLFICGHSLMVQKAHRRAPDGSPMCCGEYQVFKPIAHGLDWLARNFDARRNPGTGAWYYYYMYAVERVGILSGLRFFGVHDWYRAGAARLVQLQRADGSWHENNTTTDTAFALLFLAKGHRPTLVHKLRWSDDGRWNSTHNDLEHLVAFYADKTGSPATWDSVALGDDVGTWLTAPILYFNGGEFPKLDDQSIARMREYVHQGGTILAVASCDRTRFREGFEAFAKVLFPDIPMARLQPDHPVFSTVFKIDGGKIELYGIGVGCRTSVLFHPADIACYWEIGDQTERGLEAFQLGTNIAAYATGLEPLPDKLDVVRLVERARQDTERSVPPRGAVYFAQLMHSGDWRPNPRAIPQLADYLYQNMGVDVVPKYEPLRATDPQFVQHPLVYMTGHYSFALAADEVAALRLHLQRGGFLFANACCGRKAFDTSFRELAALLFPDHPLEPLPPDHPIILGRPGVPLDKVTYRPSTLAEEPGLSGVHLEGISLDGRLVVVYSKLSIDCGMDGHACFACRGLVPDDARRVAGNVVLYALSF